MLALLRVARSPSLHTTAAAACAALRPLASRSRVVCGSAEHGDGAVGEEQGDGREEARRMHEDMQEQLREEASRMRAFKRLPRKMEEPDGAKYHPLVTDGTDDMFVQETYDPLRKKRFGTGSGKHRVFVDRVRVKVKGGRGGDGCVSFYRGPNVPRGGPDGGDGGEGGSVYIRSTKRVSHLAEVHYYHNARHGAHGMGKAMSGKGGASRIIDVPVGTVVIDTDTGDVLADLAEPGMEFTAARGGRGGLGNQNFATPEERAPELHTEGTLGVERCLTLEMKCIADIGLVGFPNAGKSTLVGALSKAKPKVAAYAFTTLHPTIGTVQFDDGERITVADIPGLVRGAHADVGLGHDFLRHIERTSALAYVLDMSATDCRPPWKDYQVLRDELQRYQPALLERPSVVIANKMDKHSSAVHNLARMREVCAREDTPLLAVSALTGDNLDEVRAVFRHFVHGEVDDAWDDDTGM